MSLADFGCSVKLESETATRKVPIGSRGYIPPEMLNNQPYGLSADIWSLGALMHKLLANQTPFHSENEKAMMQKVVNEPLNFDSREQFSRVTP